MWLGVDLFFSYLLRLFCFFFPGNAGEYWGPSIYFNISLHTFSLIVIRDLFLRARYLGYLVISWIFCLQFGPLESAAWLYSRLHFFPLPML